MMIAAPTYRFTRSRSGNESGEKVGGAPGATVAVAAGARPGWCGKQPRTESVIAITTTTNAPTQRGGRAGVRIIARVPSARVAPASDSIAGRSMVALRLSVSLPPRGSPSVLPVRPCATRRRDRRNPERGRKARQAPSSDRGSRRPRLSSPRGGSAEAFRLRGSRHGTLLGPRPSRREYPPPETAANTTRTNMRVSHRFWGRAGTIERDPCSMPRKGRRSTCGPVRLRNNRGAWL
jgi:hypothetical protein